MIIDANENVSPAQRERLSVRGSIQGEIVFNCAEVLGVFVTAKVRGNTFIYRLIS